MQFFENQASYLMDLLSIPKGLSDGERAQMEILRSKNDTFAVHQLHVKSLAH